MAAAIRYLSADNHAADSPPVKLVDTEPPPAHCRLVFEGTFRFLGMWPSEATWVRALQIEPEEMLCVFTYTLPLLAHSTL